MSRKFQFVMSSEMEAILNELREKTGKPTYADVLRDALITYLVVVEQYDAGNDILGKALDRKTIPVRAALALGRSR